MTLPDESLAPGMLFDRYELLARCARGGMGEVWLARLVGKFGFERLFALKTIKSMYAAQPAARAMFMDEANMASRIANEHVVSIVDLGEAGGMLYMTMEWVDGDALTMFRALAHERAVPWQVVVRAGLDACAGLQAAHEARGADGQELAIVHRDVSPHNILVTDGGIAKVIDFGIAKARARLAPESEAGSVKGKIRYLAPEQIRGETGPWTDVFALGVTMYELLNGRSPFDGTSAAEVIGRLLDPDPAAPLPSSVPPAIAEAVLQSIAKDHGKRFRSMRAFRAALDEAALDSGGRPDHQVVSRFVRKHVAEVPDARRRFVQDAVKSRPSGPTAPPPPLLASTPPFGAPPPMIVTPAPPPPTEVESESRNRASLHLVLASAVVISAIAFMLAIIRWRNDAASVTGHDTSRSTALTASDTAHTKPVTASTTWRPTPMSYAEASAFVDAQPPCKKYFDAMNACVASGQVAKASIDTIHDNIVRMTVLTSTGLDRKSHAESLAKSCTEYLAQNATYHRDCPEGSEPTRR